LANFAVCEGAMKRKMIGKPALGGGGRILVVRIGRKQGAPKTTRQ